MLAAHLGQEAIAAHPGAPVLRLTVDRDLQASLETLAAERARSLGPKLSVAMVVADHLTGDILASVGSPGLFEDDRDGHVDMTRAIRSPGSTLKPFIYGLAFEAGPRPSGEPDRGPADRLPRLRADAISTASTAVR